MEDEKEMKDGKPLDDEMLKLALQLVRHQKQLRLEHIPMDVLLHIVHHLDLKSIVQFLCVCKTLNLLSNCNNLLFSLDPCYMLTKYKNVDFNIKYCWSNLQKLDISYCITSWRLNVDDIDEYINDRKQNVNKYFKQMFHPNWSKTVQHLSLELEGEDMYFVNKNIVQKLPKFMNLTAFHYAVIWEDEPVMIEWDENNKNNKYIGILDTILYNKIHPFYLKELVIDDFRVSLHILKYLLHCKQLETLIIHNVYQSDNYWKVQHSDIEKWIDKNKNNCHFRLDHLKKIEIDDWNNQYHDICDALYDLHIFIKLLMRNCSENSVNLKICADDCWSVQSSTNILFHPEIGSDIIITLKEFYISGKSRFVLSSSLYFTLPLLQENKFRREQKRHISRFILDRFTMKIYDFSVWSKDEKDYFSRFPEFFYLLMDSINNTVIDFVFDIRSNELNEVNAINECIKKFRKRIFGCSGNHCNLYFNGYVCKCCGIKMSEKQLAELRSDSFIIRISVSDRIECYRQKVDFKIKLKDCFPVLFDFLPTWMSVIYSLKTKLFNSFRFEYTFTSDWDDDETLDKMTQYLRMNYKHQLIKIDKHHTHCYTYYLKLV
eukprot:292401_1